MKLRTLALLLSVAALGAAASAPVEAGTFEIVDVSPVTTTSQTWYQGVETQATARYFGSHDANDDGYLIQTFMNDSLGGDLNDWNNPDHFGDGRSGSGIYEGMILSCTGSCAAYANFYREACPETYNYKGKAGVTIYHQFNPEIDIDYSGVYTVGCYTPPDGGGGGGGGGVDGCGTAGYGSTMATGISVETGETLSHGPGTHPLTRQDVQDRMRYLLEEWAVFSVTPGSRGTHEVEPLNSSSQQFAASEAARLKSEMRPKEAGTILVVEGLDHPRNERHIPTPEVRIAGEPFAGGSPEQEMVLRADFDASGDLADLDVIHTTGAVPEELLADLRSRLTLAYEGPSRHRAIAFVVLDLGDSLAIRSSHTVLPLCCCYTDETGIWCE